MSRDEARHAGFLNKAMSDFNLQLDLGFLTKSKKYTFFKPKFIFYATYLSEKIGYWRYITIYRHLESHPENQIYPIFRFFENWCQDENRHGDFFSALMKAQPDIINDWKAKLWCRFFLLSVFATMFLNDIQRSGFYASLGLDAREYDVHVIQKTNETAARVFPVILDVDNPEFFKRLDMASDANSKLAAISESNQPKPLQLLRKLPHVANIGWQMVRLYFMKPVEVLAYARRSTLTFLPELFSFPPAALSLMRFASFIWLLPRTIKNQLGAFHRTLDSAGSGCRLSVLMYPPVIVPAPGIILWWNTLKQENFFGLGWCPGMLRCFSPFGNVLAGLLALGMLSQTHAAVASGA